MIFIGKKTVKLCEEGRIPSRAPALIFAKRYVRLLKCPLCFSLLQMKKQILSWGLTSWGDDCITKSFKLAVFLSRINALLRRSENFNTAVTELNSNDVNIPLLKGKVYKKGKLIDLTASEYKLLCLFMENPDRILSPEQILGKLWDCRQEPINMVQCALSAWTARSLPG